MNTQNIGGNMCIPVYTGETSVVDFITNFGRLRALAGWDKAQAAAHLPFYLSNVALARYNTLLANVKGDADLAIPALKVFFCDVGTKTYYLTKLSQIKQSEHESINSYYCRVTDLANTAYEAIGSADRAPLVLNNFVQGLIPQIHKQLILVSPDSLESAYSTAIQIELTD